MQNAVKCRKDTRKIDCLWKARNCSGVVQLLVELAGYKTFPKEVEAVVLDHEKHCAAANCIILLLFGISLVCNVFKCVRVVEGHAGGVPKKLRETLALKACTLAAFPLSSAPHPRPPHPSSIHTPPFHAHLLTIIGVSDRAAVSTHRSPPSPRARPLVSFLYPLCLFRVVSGHECPPDYYHANSRNDTTVTHELSIRSHVVFLFR